MNAPSNTAAQQPDWEPFLVRLSGLPTSTMDSFHSDLPGQLLKLEEIERAVAGSRALLVNEIHQRLSTLPGELRRLALAAKRDAFNARGLSRVSRQPGWASLTACLPAATALLQLEHELAARHAALDAEMRAQEHRETVALAELLEDAQLRRGLALSSPVLVEQLERGLDWPHGRHQESPKGRKERKVMVSLLRYMSRAALKLSPYSTLTRVALGAVVSSPGIGLLGDATANWNSRSLIRLQRYILTQVLFVLQQYAPFRDTLELQWNPTAFERDGRWQWLRPAGWQIDPTSQRLRVVQQSLVKASFEGDVLRWLAEQTQAVKTLPTLQTLRQLASQELPEQKQQEFESLLDRLLELGLVLFRSPIPVFEPRLEEGLAHHLEKLERQGCQDPGLAGVKAELQAILALQAALPTSPDPTRDIDLLEKAIPELWRQTTLLGPWPEAQLAQNLDDHFFEDVFVSGPGAHSELLVMGREITSRLRHDLASLVHLTTLLDRRFELLLTLSAAVRRQWPSRDRVPILEAFTFLQSITRDFRAFLSGGQTAGTFNPLGLSEVDQVANLRNEVLSGLRAAIRPLGDHEYIDPADLALLVDRIPAAFRSPVGACFFLQPCDVEGKMWVMNWLHEGIGRFGSRFTAVMEPGLRERFGRHRQHASHAWADRAESLDMITGGENLNCHYPLTVSCLTGPGENPNGSPGRVLGVEDLYLSINQETGLPRLEDADGRPLLPVHLGESDHRLLPVFLKFLSYLGPGDLFGRLPSNFIAADKYGIEILPRLTLGGVVVRRTRWVVPTAGLAEEIAALDPLATFVAINRWRLARSLPERAFIIERIASEHAQTRYKPQYLDFSSPLFVAIFKAALTLNREKIEFEELLPGPETALRDDAGRPWAIELLLDEVGLAPVLHESTRLPEVATAPQPLLNTIEVPASGVLYAGV